MWRRRQLSPQTCRVAVVHKAAGRRHRAPWPYRSVHERRATCRWRHQHRSPKSRRCGRRQWYDRHSRTRSRQLPRPPRCVRLLPGLPAIRSTRDRCEPVRLRRAHPHRAWLSDASWPPYEQRHTRQQVRSALTLYGRHARSTHGARARGASVSRQIVGALRRARRPTGVPPLDQCSAAGHPAWHQDAVRSRRRIMAAWVVSWAYATHRARATRVAAIAESRVV